MTPAFMDSAPKTRVCNLTKSLESLLSSTTKANGFFTKALRYNRDNSLEKPFNKVSDSLSGIELLGETSRRSAEIILSSTTLLLNGVNELSTEQIQQQLVGLSKSIYKNLQVIIAVSDKKTTKNHNLPNVKKLILNGDQREVVRKMLASVNTKYVIVAREMVILNFETSIEGLLRPILNKQADIVGSTYVNEEKEWVLGCSLTRTLWSQFRTLDGVEAKNPSLIVCDSLTGPFAVEKDKLLKVVNLKILEGGSMFYANVFYHISETNRDTITRLCLECSSEIVKKRKTADESEILQFLKQTQLSTMILNNGSRMEYTCEKIGLACSRYSSNGKRNGMFRPRCCIMELHYLLVRTSEVLNKHKFPYELDGGTVLGAVKFSHTLPWERDHDYEFRLDSKSRWPPLRKEIEKLGYSTEARGNYIGLKSRYWRLEANGVGAMMRDFISLKNNTKIAYRGHYLPRSRIFANATLVRIGTSWIPNNTNPGQFARSRYGVSCLKHAWHWSELGKSTSHIIYKPGNWGTPCKSPGHHTCSDNYVCDGSLQFEDVW